MFRILRFLLTGYWNQYKHIHKWKIYKKEDVIDKDDNSIKVAELYILQCETCGEMKSQEFRAWG